MSAAEPGISVVVASYERRELLRRYLDSLRGQDADPSSFEVIVVDDGSRDGTAEMVGEQRTPFECRLIRRPNRGQASALNAGIEAARAPLCLVMDDDLIASPGLVAAHLGAHDGADERLAIGALSQHPVEDPRDWYAHAFAESWNRRHGELTRRPAYWSDCYGANFSVATARLREVGGFDAELPAGYDLELAYRLVEAGCEPRYVAAAEAVHDDGKSGRRIVADQHRYGTVCPALVRLHPGMSPRTIDWYRAASPRELALRRLLLTLSVRPAWLLPPGRLLPAGRARMLWFDFVSHYAFWQGVREAADPAHWRQIVDTPVRAEA